MVYRKICLCQVAPITSVFFSALHGMPARTSYEKDVCLSLRPSVRLSNAWIVTEWKTDLSRFLHHTKDHLAEFPEKKKGCWG